ncbi:TnsA endonuclease N-terminal domain-containing protein [Paenibacillus sp. BC26]|uniref:TnsA endonuclease N-terminal domain-containing protein n=1 Tax=Paenibacillus sp. BC26 TaxID=1881032 RepID=UPI0008E7D703|nr:TnsA endonuclease N-terminal domain-containing protein [Paenibacillus sp. BC26]SFT05852.1 TnsA endonuclease N terminal [Paenibacillus sp. BC26]
MARPTADETMVFGESLLERDFVRFCNFQCEIVGVEYQPLTISYNYKRRVRKYTPDFRLTDENGGTTIVEVKPSKHVNDPDNVIKFEVAKIFCQEHGWKFKVMTELDLHKGHLSKNINIILDVMRYEFDTHDLMVVFERLQKVGSCTIKELHLYTPEVDVPRFTAIVYRLLLDRFFKADLFSQRISEQTILSINEGKVW